MLFLDCPDGDHPAGLLPRLHLRDQLRQLPPGEDQQRRQPQRAVRAHGGRPRQPGEGARDGLGVLLRLSHPRYARPREVKAEDNALPRFARNNFETATEDPTNASLSFWPSHVRVRCEPLR